MSSECCCCGKILDIECTDDFVCPNCNGMTCREIMEIEK